MEMARKPERSSFTLTCSLLSQYIKEKGSFADLGIGMTPCILYSESLGKPETYRPPTTMSLLPGVFVPGDDLEGTKEDVSSLNTTKSMELFPQCAGFGPNSPPAEATKEPEKAAQLTIFYGGKVLVFDNFPDEKARDLMQIASKGQSFTYGTRASMAPTTGVAPVTDLKSCPALAKSTPSFSARAQPNFSDLPIARKESLHRFLEKRKARISAKAPYQLSSSNGFKNVVIVKEDEISQPGLGLRLHILKPGLC